MRKLTFNLILEGLGKKSKKLYKECLITYTLKLLKKYIRKHTNKCSKRFDYPSKLYLYIFKNCKLVRTFVHVFIISQRVNTIELISVLLSDIWSLRNMINNSSLPAKVSVLRVHQWIAFISPLAKIMSATYAACVCWCVVVYVFNASGNDSMLSIDVRPIFLDMLATRACYNNNKNIIIILIITISHTGFDLHVRHCIVYFVIVLVFFHLSILVICLIL